VHAMQVLDMAAGLQTSLAVRFACLLHQLGRGTTGDEDGCDARSVQLLQTLCKRLRVPQECAELTEVVAREHANIHRSAALGPDALLGLLERCDAIRKPARMAEVLLACECIARGRSACADAAYPQRPRIASALQQVLAVATAPIAAAAQLQGATGLQIGAAVRRARLAALSLPPT